MLHLVVHVKSNRNSCVKTEKKKKKKKSAKREGSSEEPGSFLTSAQLASSGMTFVWMLDCWFLNSYRNSLKQLHLIQHWKGEGRDLVSHEATGTLSHCGMFRGGWGESWASPCTQHFTYGTTNAIWIQSDDDDDTLKKSSSDSIPPHLPLIPSTQYRKLKAAHHTLCVYWLPLGGLSV